MRRHCPAAVVALTSLLVIGGCGGGASLVDYVDETNVIVARASERGDALLAAAEESSQVTPRNLQAGLEAGVAIREELQAAADGLEPPEVLSDLHDLMWQWHREFIAVEKAVAVRAGETEATPEGWYALSQSPEVAAYRSALAEGARVCEDLQARLDGIADRGDMSDSPWVPSAMESIVEAVLGCEYFPDDPEGVFRFPEP